MDSALRAVEAALTALSADLLLVDQSAVLASELELRVAGAVEGWLCTKDREVALPSVTAAYLRTYDWTELPFLSRCGPDSPERRHADRFHHALWTWTDITPANVVNRPAAMATNGSKPYQQRIIAAMGFATPRTLLTTSPDAALAFWEEHRTVIYKSVSGVRSIVSRLTPGHLPRLRHVITCPTQFQEYVPGVDHRVHVVGDEVFCSRIVTDADDYRYAHSRGYDIDIQAARLPEEWDDACRQLTSTLGLRVAGIDLRVTPEGSWYCFEVNPSPAFTFYDRSPGAPIAQAVARLLAGPRLKDACG